jgi:hypothetical protein
MQKRDKTLLEFVREAKLNLNKVLDNIEILGKRV